MKDQINTKFQLKKTTSKERKESLIISKFNIQINQINLRLAIVGRASYAIRDDNYKLENNLTSEYTANLPSKVAPSNSLHFIKRFNPDLNIPSLW